MILLKNRKIYLQFGLILIISFFSQAYGQKILRLDTRSGIRRDSSIQDTAIEHGNRDFFTGEQPDTNFTWEKYGAFLSKISDTSKYIVLPLNEFRKTIKSNKIVIGLRHDVDNDLDVAYQFSETEWKLGFRSTYFILHTAPYYLETPNNYSSHSQKIIPVLKAMQDNRKFEIGWHNDLVTLQLIYKLNPVLFLHDELGWLRSNGINISGTASHGSSYCKTYRYLNYYFFYDCTYPVVPGYENNVTVPVGNSNITIIKGNLSDFDLEYEAYFLKYNKAFSDATITNNIRWNIGMLDLKQLKAGDRVVILLHPIHWHKASVLTKIESFTINGQNSSSIDYENAIINVEMPYGTNLGSLVANFSLSPGAYSKVSGRQQVNGSTRNNFTNPVIYEVFAENRDIHKYWTVNVHWTKNAESDFTSFNIPGLTRSVNIDKIQKKIFLKLSEGADLTNLPVQFELSAGATAWIGNVQHFGNGSIHDFSGNLQYTVIAENKISLSTWLVIVQKVRNLANVLSFSVPGFTESATIDTVNNSVLLKTVSDIQVNQLYVSLKISDGAQAWIGNQELLSDFQYLDLTDPVAIDIVAEDRRTHKRWTLSVLQKAGYAKGELAYGNLVVYPNPTIGFIEMQFRNILTSPTMVEIYNALGNKVFDNMVAMIGNFTVEADISNLPAGVYFLKYSKNDKPIRLVVHEH
jgi:hypothetical protein